MLKLKMCERYVFIVNAHIARVCPGATSVTMDSPSEYEFLEGSNQFLMPAGGVFIPTKTYHAVKRAPLLRGSARCEQPTTSAIVIRKSAPVRLEIVSSLGESIPFIDQGFASFNRACQCWSESAQASGG